MNFARTKMIDVTSHNEIAFSVDGETRSFDLRKDLTEKMDPDPQNLYWKPKTYLKEGIFFPELEIGSDGGAQIFLLRTVGTTIAALYPATEAEIQEHLPESWRLTIGYLRFEFIESAQNQRKRKRVGDYHVYNLVLRWCKNLNNKTFLCLEERKHGEDSFYLEKDWLKNESKVQLRLEKNLIESLVSKKGCEMSRRIFMWNGRNKTIFNPSIGLSNPVSTLPVLHCTTLENLRDKNTDYKASKVQERFLPKVGNKVLLDLPRGPIEWRIDDIDLFIDDPVIQSRFHTAISHGKLAEVIGCLPEMIRQEVIIKGANGKRELEQTLTPEELLIGALADRFFSSLEWKMKPPNQVKDAKITKSSVDVDIDQVVLMLYDMTNHTSIREGLQCFNHSVVDIHVKQILTAATTCFNNIWSDLQWKVQIFKLLAANKKSSQEKELVDEHLNTSEQLSNYIKLEMLKIGCQASVLSESIHNILTDERIRSEPDQIDLFVTKFEFERLYEEVHAWLSDILHDLTKATFSVLGTQLSIISVQVQIWKLCTGTEMFRARTEAQIIVSQSKQINDNNTSENDLVVDEDEVSLQSNCSTVSDFEEEVEDDAIPQCSTVSDFEEEVEDDAMPQQSNSEVEVEVEGNNLSEKESYSNFNEGVPLSPVEKKNLIDRITLEMQERVLSLTRKLRKVNTGNSVTEHNKEELIKCLCSPVSRTKMKDLEKRLQNDDTLNRTNATMLLTRMMHLKTGLLELAETLIVKLYSKINSKSENSSPSNAEEYLKGIGIELAFPSSMIPPEIALDSERSAGLNHDLTNEFSLFGLLRKTHMEIKHQVFHDTLGAHQLVLNFRAIGAHMRKIKGGHTYMSSQGRKDYIPIYTPSQGDVLKLSVSFRNSKKKGTCSILKSPFHADFLTSRYYRMEKFLRENHFRDSKTDWMSKKKEEKAIIAYYLTCEYLCITDDHAQDKLEFEKLFYATTEYQIKVRNGFMFPYLYPFTLSFLEHTLGDNSTRLHFVYETYGMKGRASSKVYLGETACIKEATERILAGNKILTSQSIWQFAKYMHEETRKHSNKLIIGYGCNFCADSNGIPQYPAIDAYRLRQDLAPTKLGRKKHQQNMIQADDHEDSFEFGPVIKAIPVADKNSDQFTDDRSNEADDVEDISKFEWKKWPYRDSFNVLGNTVPARLQPITIQCREHRFQIYSVNLRHALGEDSQVQSASTLASDVLLYLPGLSGSNTTQNANTIPDLKTTQKENTNCYHIDRHYKNVVKWLGLVSHNCKNLEKHGNICRIEVAHPIHWRRLDQLEKEVESGISSTLHYCCKYGEVYSASDIAQIANFFAKALAFRVHVAHQAAEGCYPATADGIRIYNVLSETFAYIKNFYSGRRSGGNFNISGKKLGKKFNRPFLKTVSNDFYDELWRLGITDFDNLWKAFQKRLGVTFNEPFHDLFRHRYPENFPRKLVCEHCMRIVDEGVDAGSHPCLDGAKLSMLKFTDPIIIKKIREMREKSLSADQQQVIQALIDSRTLGDSEVSFDFNAFITGVAGSGKTTTARIFLLEFLRLSQGRATVAVVSPTKNAAGILYGKTINSFFRLGKCEDLDYNQNPDFPQNFFNKCYPKRNEKEFSHIKNLEVLLIDECSLLTARGLQNIDSMLRMLRGSGKPFGGIQVILIGDPLQLPPVINDSLYKRPRSIASNELMPSNEFTQGKWDCDWRFFFQAPCFWNSDFVVFYFSESYRQSGDFEFSQVLNRVRDGTIKENKHLAHDLNFLNNCCGRKVHRDIVEITFRAEQEYHQTRKAGLNDFFKEESRFSQKLEDIAVINHFKNLETDSRKLDIAKSFIICAENEEALAIGSALDTYISSKKNIVPCKAKDRFSLEQNIHKNDLLAKEVRKYPLEELSECYEKPHLCDELSKLTKRETYLNLYVGKVVKFVSNSLDPFIANNMLGIIKTIKVDKSTGEISQIIVQPIPHERDLVGKEIAVKPMSETYYLRLNEHQPASLFELHSKADVENNQYWKLDRVQFPVHSANAGTAYIYQGITCPWGGMMLVCPQYFQHAGAAYTAFSRARNKDQLFLLFPLTANDIIVDPIAKDFDVYHRPPEIRKGRVRGLHVSYVDYFYEGSQRVLHD